MNDEETGSTRFLTIMISLLLYINLNSALQHNGVIRAGVGGGGAGLVSSTQYLNELLNWAKLSANSAGNW